MSNALGLIETKGLIAAIEATDAAAKAAAVVVSAAELTDAAYMTIRIEGELGAVQAAVAAGAAAAQRVGELVAVHVIPRPDEGLEAITPTRRYVSKYHERDFRRPLVYGKEPSVDKPKRTVTPPQDRPAAPPAKPAEEPARVSKPSPPPIQKTDAVSAAPVIPAAPAQPVGRAEEPNWKELEEMSVVRLRQFARAVKNLPIVGRQISMANKEQLLAAIKAAFGVD